MSAWGCSLTITWFQSFLEEETWHVGWYCGRSFDGHCLPIGRHVAVHTKFFHHFLFEKFHFGRLSMNKHNILGSSLQQKKIQRKKWMYNNMIKACSNESNLVTYVIVQSTHKYMTMIISQLLSIIIHLAQELHDSLGISMSTEEIHTQLLKGPTELNSTHRNSPKGHVLHRDPHVNYLLIYLNLLSPREHLVPYSACHTIPGHDKLQGGQGGGQEVKSI